MFRLFSRRAKLKTAPETVRQLTASERRFLDLPGIPPAGLPYAVYDQMQSDGMVQTALSVKRQGVLAAPYRIRPADDSPSARERATFAERALERIEGSVADVLGHALDAFAKGWSVQELVWDSDGRETWLAAVRPKDPSFFGLRVDSFGQIRSLVLHLPGEAPQTIPRSKFAIYRNRSGYRHPKGRSDLDAAHPHWQAKQALLAAWKFHLERFASPTVLGRFQRGLPPQDQEAILGALRDLNRHTAILFPEELTLGTMGGEREASTGFLEAIEFHNREIARAILGQTLATDEGRRVGSLALGKVHLQVLMLQIEAIRRDLAETLMTEQILRPLVEMNFGRGQLPKFEFEAGARSVFATGLLA
ncbi:MAG: DUF935 family protein [Fimbriimonadaceae bacterium]